MYNDIILRERVADSRVIPITQLKVGDYFKMSENGSIKGPSYKVVSIDRNSKGSQDTYITYKNRQGEQYAFSYDTTEPDGGRYVTWVKLVDDRIR